MYSTQMNLIYYLLNALMDFVYFETNYRNRLIYILTFGS